MAQPYDPKKAETFNKLRQQGLSIGDAAAQAGIANQSGDGTYVITGKFFPDPPGGRNPNPGTIGAPVEGTQKRLGVDYDNISAADAAENARFDRGLDSSSNFEQVDYQVAAKNPPGKVTPINYTTTSTETVSGGGSTSQVSGPRIPTATSQALQPAINEKQAQIDQFRKDNPGDYERKQQGLPPLSKEESDRNIAKVIALKKERDDLQKEQRAAESTTPPTTTTVPNTTTTTQTVTTGTAATNQQVDPLNDEKLSQENETQLDATTSPANGSTSRSAAAVAPEDDPFEQSRLDAEARLNEPPAAIEPAGVSPEDDPFEAARLDAEARLDDPPSAIEPAPVENPPYDENAGLEEAIRARAAEPVDEPLTAAQQEAALEEASAGATLSAADVDAADDRNLEVQEEIRAEAAAAGVSFPDTNNDTTAAATARAKSQGTLQSRYKQPGNGDWRVRLSLAPNSDYLYNASAAGILAPLTATNGVIFPYTPNISTTYSADYEKYNLIHSNYRGVFYKSSSVGDVQIRATFTAQDTREAAYLLAVIHFFRSVTKMFYGQDTQRGTPPPLVYLSGYGDQQFSNHSCVVSAFNYTLPNEVDYIRTNAPNNFGPNMSNRQTPRTTSPGGINFSGAIRLANALLNKGATPQTPAQNPLRSYVNNTNECTYVPTKMEIDITLIPVQTRSQVSKQFSLEKFATGQLLKGGFW